MLVLVMMLLTIEILTKVELVSVLWAVSEKNIPMFQEGYKKIPSLQSLIRCGGNPEDNPENSADDGDLAYKASERNLKVC